MTMQATATFAITSWDETTYAAADAAPRLARATVHKTFQGDVTGNSTAELLMSQANDEAAGYVALERFTGRIADQAGSFDMQHGGITDGSPHTVGVVVPGSGTGALRGLRGTVTFQHDAHGAVFTLAYDVEAEPH
jgi:hypothetical protein